MPDTEVETVTKADHDRIVAGQKVELEKLQANYKAVQRSLSAAQRRGADVAQLETKLAGIEKLQLGVLQTLGKLGVEGLDTTTIVEQYQQDKSKSEQSDKAHETASRAIVEAFRAAGIADEEFDAVWTADARFGEARAAYAAGNYTAAVAATVKAVTSKPDAPPPDVNKLIEEAVAKDRQQRGAVVDSGKRTASGSDEFDYEAWAKKPIRERLKDMPKAKEWLAKNG